MQRIFEPLNFEDPRRLFIGICECLASAAITTFVIYIIIMASEVLSKI